MFLILVVGSCCGAYRTWKSNDDTSFDGIESSRTTKIQVNKYTNILTLGSFRILFGFTRLTSGALFKKIHPNCPELALEENQNPTVFERV